jgi:SAM-dependent methyltransferase
MSEENPNLIDAALHLNLDLLQALQEKPEPFTPGEKLFWDDPHISKGMLATHLDPTIDLASRRPETIDRTVAWIVETLDLGPGDSVLDLGCGPGLYTQRFAQWGLRVSGMDYSRAVQCCLPDLWGFLPAVARKTSQIAAEYAPRPCARWTLYPGCLDQGRPNVVEG